MIGTTQQSQINMGYCIEKFYIYVRKAPQQNFTQFQINAKYQS